LDRLLLSTNSDEPSEILPEKTEPTEHPVEQTTMSPPEQHKTAPKVTAAEPEVTETPTSSITTPSPEQAETTPKATASEPEVTKTETEAETPASPATTSSDEQAETAPKVTAAEPEVTETPASPTTTSSPEQAEAADQDTASEPEATEAPDSPITGPIGTPALYTGQVEIPDFSAELHYHHAPPTLSRGNSRVPAGPCPTCGYKEPYLSLAARKKLREEEAKRRKAEQKDKPQPKYSRTKNIKNNEGVVMPAQPAKRAPKVQVRKP